MREITWWGVPRFSFFFFSYISDLEQKKLATWKQRTQIKSPTKPDLSNQPNKPENF